MIDISTVTLRNFLSYGNNTTVFHLDRPGATLIVGENLDNTTNGLGANGVGKAQPLHCKIKIPGGWTTMGDINTGDVVSTPNGGTANVIGVFPQGSRPTYRITFADGRSTEADENHLWSCFSHRWGKQQTRGEKLITTLELRQFVLQAQAKKKSWYNVAVPKVSGFSGDDVALPINPYLLGALIGDGSFTSRQVTFTNKDAECISHVSQALMEHNCELRRYTTDINYNIQCADGTRTNYIADLLEELQMLGCNSYTKFIPKMYLEGSRDQRMELLRGLLDTDGTAGKTRNISYATSSHTLANDVQYLVRSLGGNAIISTRSPTYTHKGNQHTGQISYNVSIRLPNPKDSFSVSAKKERVSNRSQYADEGLRVTNVEYIGEQVTKCILIDSEDHLYVTDDFVVTHNTALINAVTYAIYDRPISKISKDNLVNNINGKNMEVTIEFTNGDGHQYKVKRERKARAGAAGNNVYFYVDGVDKSVDSAGTNKMIEEAVGIPYDLFVRIVVFSASHTPFLDLPVTHVSAPNQKDIIEELFGMTVLTAKAEELKKHIKDNETSLNMKKAKVELQEKEQQRHRTLIESAEKRVLSWKSQNSYEIADIKDKLAAVESIDFDAERTLHNEVDRLQTQVNEVTVTLRTDKRTLKDLTSAYTKAEGELKHLRDAKCPYCLQDFANAAKKINSLESETANLFKQIDEIEPKVVETADLYATLMEQLDAARSKITITDLDELIEVKNQSVVLRQKIIDLENAVNPFVEPLKELMDAETSAVDYSEVNKLTREIEHQKFLQKLLTKKDSFVRKELMNKNIPFLNKKLREYLHELGLPHVVEFTHEMTAKISQFGRELDFGNLSAGQAARVNLALAWGFKDVRERQSDKVNICMLDEVLDHGLDAVGVEAAAKMIKMKAAKDKQAVFVVSHRDEAKTIFPNTMTVQMSRGFSYIKEEVTENAS